MRICLIERGVEVGRENFVEFFVEFHKSAAEMKNKKDLKSV